MRKQRKFKYRCSRCGATIEFDEALRGRFSHAPGARWNCGGRWEIFYPKPEKEVSDPEKVRGVYNKYMNRPLAPIEEVMPETRETFTRMMAAVAKMRRKLKGRTFK